MRLFCCPGCQAVSTMIEQGGLSRYYDLREKPATKVDDTAIDIFNVYDIPTMQSGWVTRGRISSAEILIDNMHCPACIWLIESWMMRLPDVTSAYVSLNQSRLTVQWRGEELQLSRLFRHLKEIGYDARPFSSANKQELLNAQRQTLLKQLGIAAVFGMQVMVISVALYSGDWFGIDPTIRYFLERVALLLILPVIFYSARPFFSGAIRNLRSATVGMDIPVSIGLSLAFMGSIWATFSNSGEIYYDSIAMFVFFLLGARYLELTARIKGSTAMDTLANATPEYATLYCTEETTDIPKTVPAVELNVGDRIVVKPGEVVPADGLIMDRPSTFDESLISGEHTPILRTIGEQVLSGSINTDQAVQIQVNRKAENTTLSSILRLARTSNQDKPKVALLSQSVASYFVIAVIFIATAVAMHGLVNESAEWLSTTIAVLVVTCPCALSLATPLAISASINTLMSKGVFVTKQHALETLSNITHVVFDKTGTLTTDTPQLTNIHPLQSTCADDCLKIAASLEQFAVHPIGKALLSANQAQLYSVESHQSSPGLGISGYVNHQRYYLGSKNFIATQLKRPMPQNHPPIGHEGSNTNGQICVILANDQTELAIFTLDENIRPGVKSLIDHLKKHKIGISLYSGDQQSTVDKLAHTLRINDAKGCCKPSKKLIHINDHIQEGRVVAMIGDGMNDSPALSQAHLAIACSGNVNLSAANADIVLTNKSIDILQCTHRFAIKTRKIIRQNISWAIVYNLCAVPAAIEGWIPPWLAGIGMSLSSIVVVLNASRLNTLENPSMGKS